jgi:signal transduction histidine kinase
VRLSTHARLLGAASLAMLLLLPTAGGLLSGAFRESAEAAIDERLEVNVHTLAGLAEVAPKSEIAFSRSLGDLRYDQVFSGWYWQIEYQKEVEASSRSLWDTTLDLPEAVEPGRHQFFRLRGPRNEKLRGVQLAIRMPPLTDPIIIAATAPQSSVTEQVHEFNRLLGIALGSLGLLLIFAFWLQIRWGLAPLRQMRRDLVEVRAGRRPKLDESLPSDLSQVAGAMNEVLAHQEALIERGRSVAGNLAHALKTPLAAMRLQLDAPQGDAGILRAQLAEIRRIVDHHLSRASAAGRAGSIRRTRFSEAVAPVLHAIRAMHAARGLRIDEQLLDDEVALDAQDLQELIGNLADNAAKFARSRVRIVAETLAGGSILVLVDDDGPGIPEPERRQVVERGVRLDEAHAGSGLGLSIVQDLVRLYDLDLEFATAPIGGLRVQLLLPRAD